MILSIVRTGFMNLRRDRSALLLSFVLPVVFFSIFAVIFGGRSNGTPRVAVAVVDEDRSDGSSALVRALAADKGLRASTGRSSKDKAEATAFTRETAEAAVRAGDYSVALVIPKGFGTRPISFGPLEQGATRPSIMLLQDSSDPIGAQVVAGLLQRAAMTSMPYSLASSGMQYFEAATGGLSTGQQDNVRKSLEDLKAIQDRARTGAGGTASESDASASTSASGSSEMEGLVSVDIRDVVGGTKADPIIAFYAAGVGVMFLLFSASGAGGAILEEAENGTLDRVLSTKVTMTTLLAGKMLWLALVGFTQLCVMFLWGALVFKVELFSHLPGFLVMTFVSSLAASGLGLALATSCRTRAQLGAVSTLVILTMSALGGSMFPRFIMSETLQRVGLLTFNGWALDGYQKVFWRDAAVWQLWPQVLVLLACAGGFFLLARRLARRWETA